MNKLKTFFIKVKPQFQDIPQGPQCGRFQFAPTWTTYYKPQPPTIKTWSGQPKRKRKRKKIVTKLLIIQPPKRPRNAAPLETLPYLQMWFQAPTMVWLFSTKLSGINRSSKQVQYDPTLPLPAPA